MAPAPLLLLLVPALPGSAAQSGETPNAFFARGTPTFVLGTAGDERCDRILAAQVELVRGMLFPDAAVVADRAVGQAWPANPVLYGGAHVNALVAALAPELPLVVDAGRIALGGERFEGEEYRLIAFVPAGTGHPDFLLYAGAGTPGVEEINGVFHGGEGFVVADRFGALVRGAWERGDGGVWRARLGPRARRIEWRASTPDAARLRVLRPAMLAPNEREAAEDAAIERGLARAEQLGLALGAALETHVYPDRGSKRSLCGNPGDGHADAISRTLHVIAFEPDALEDLVAHEATHVLAAARLAPAGSPLLGEGLAVWVSGQYAGKSLAHWRGAFAEPVASLAELLGPRFRALPEATSYPLAGLLVETLVAELGRERVLDTLYPATAATWDAACERAGTSAARIEAAFRAAFGR